MVLYDQKELMKSFPKLTLAEVARELATAENYRFVVSYKSGSDRSKSIGCCRNERELIALLQNPDINIFKTLFKLSRHLQKA